MLWKFQNGTESWSKSRQNSDRISVKNFIFSTVADIHLAVLLKNVTHPLQVFYKEIDKISRAPIVGQTLNGYFFQKEAKSPYKKISSAWHKYLQGQETKKGFTGRPRMRNFKHPWTGNKQFFEVSQYLSQLLAFNLSRFLLTSAKV